MKFFLHSRLNSRKISTQTSLLITSTVIVSLLISASLFSLLMYRELTKNYKLLLYQESYSTITAVSDDINSVDSVYRLLISNDSIYNYMKSTNQDSSYRYTIEKQMTSVLILNNIWEKNYLKSVFVYTSDGSSFHVSKNESEESIRQNDLVYRNLSSDSPTLSLHTLDDSDDLYFVRSIYDQTSGNILGSMIVTINQEKWLEKLTSGFADDWQIFLYNDEFSLCSNSTFTEENKIQLQDSLEQSSNLQFETFTSNTTKYLTLSNHISLLDITAMVMFPQNQLQHQVFGVITYCIIIIIGIILISAIWSFIVSRFITRPITLMKEKVDAITLGDYSQNIIGLEKYEEFHELQIAINNMLTQIHQYHDNILEQNVLLKDSEIQALQSQLNPHFIFNVLSTLSWKAEMSEDPEIAQIVVALGEILRFSTVYRTTNTLTLEEELKFIHFYNYLQHIRFEDKITVTEDIDPDLEKTLIPCFGIQTLVENAYIHGLEPKADTGVLQISVKKSKNGIRITVIDNGVGFIQIPDLSKDIQQSIGSPSSVSKHPHVGLKNLNRRLCLIYGNESALKISSIPNVETKITFEIPTQLGEII